MGPLKPKYSMYHIPDKEVLQQSRLLDTMVSAGTQDSLI